VLLFWQQRCYLRVENDYIKTDDRSVEIRNETKTRMKMGKLASQFINKRLTFVYKNWRGETGKRTVVPISIRFGESKFHKGEQWIMRAFDVERKGDPVREFAMKDIQGIKRCHDCLPKTKNPCLDIEVDEISGD